MVLSISGYEVLVQYEKNHPVIYIDQKGIYDNEEWCCQSQAIVQYDPFSIKENTTVIKMCPC